MAHEEDAPTPDVMAVLAASHAELLAFVEKRVGDRAVAEDILQEAFVRAAEKEHTLRDPDAARAWFYRTLRNAVTDHHRRRGASQRALEAFAAELDAVTPGDEADAVACRCIQAVAGTLDPSYAIALKRIEIDGVPVKEYAAEVGITANNAAVRVFRARDALRKRLAQACGTCATHACFDCTCEPATGERPA